MVDEMDLVRQLQDAAPLRPEAYERARTTLRAAMAGSGPSRRPAPGTGPGRTGRFSWARSPHGTVSTLGKAGIGVGIGAIAAAAAIALVATSAPRPAAPAAQAPATGSQLVSLASYIQASSGHQTGDASLIVKTQTIGDRSPYVLYELYADSGAIYATDTEGALPAAIARGGNLADGTEAREVAAAHAAAAGDLASARLRMINTTPNYLGLGLSPAAQQKEWAKGLAAEREIYKEKGVKRAPKPYTAKSVQEEADNYLWIHAVDALTAGGGNPQVRAGVLRLISTISDVTVANSTTGGQPTLTLTAGPEVFGGQGSQVLTIAAKTGIPLKSVVDAGPGVPTSVETYQVARVTLADIKAGKF